MFCAKSTVLPAPQRSHLRVAFRRSTPKFEDGFTLLSFSSVSSRRDARTTKKCENIRQKQILQDRLRGRTGCRLHRGIGGLTLGLDGPKVQYCRQLLGRMAQTCSTVVNFRVGWPKSEILSSTFGSDGPKVQCCRQLSARVAQKCNTVVNFLPG